MNRDAPIITIGANGQGKLPSLTAVGFSLKPREGNKRHFPITVLIDDDETKPLTVDSLAGYSQEKVISSITVQGGEPGDVYEVELQPLYSDWKEQRFPTNDKGQLLTVRPSPVVLASGTLSAAHIPTDEKIVIAEADASGYSEVVLRVWLTETPGDFIEVTASLRLYGAGGTGFASRDVSAPMLPEASGLPASKVTEVVVSPRAVDATVGTVRTSPGLPRGVAAVIHAIGWGFGANVHYELVGLP